MTQSKRSISQSKKPKTRRIWIPVLILLLLIAAGGGYYYWSQQQAKASAAASSGPKFNTTQVRRGSISLSASGTGTLVASTTNQLSFSTTGTVAKVEVQVGDQVKKGQTLAELSDLDQLQANINSAQQDLITAQQALDTLKQNGPANLANAQLTLATDQKAVIDAKSAVVQPGVARCDQATTDAYYNTYTIEQKKLTDLGDGGGHPDYYLTTIVPQKNIVARAYAAYVYCAGYTNYEIDASHAKLSLAEAQLKTDQDTLNTLQKNNGINPTDLAAAQNKVDNAQSALDQAKQIFDGATLKAPYDGTILSVSGQAGDSAGTAAFISIADLAHPLIQFYIDETDLDKVAVGEQAQVVFDALPNQTFTGKVTRINPALITQNGSQAVQGMLQLDLSKETNLTILPQGLNASVLLIKAQADNALIVPVQALRDLGDGSYGVFVLQNGQPRLKVVQVGLQDAANAEIKSGLSAGDIVTTGSAQTK